MQQRNIIDNCYYMKYLPYILIALLFLAGGVFFFGTRDSVENNDEWGNPVTEMNMAAVAKKKEKPTPNTAVPSTPALVTQVNEDFSVAGEVEEAGSMSESYNLTWWVNSGAYLYASNGTGKTVQGDLSVFNPWYLKYRWANSTDTDGGKHPQNIFRLVEKHTWENFVQEGYFKINKTNLSDSTNRNASNGLLFFSRYIDSNNLYYTGLRVDGDVVIKKKLAGTYYTLATAHIFTGKRYDRKTNPNLLPLNTWIGLKTEIRTNADKSVSVKVLIDKNNSGSWVEVLNVIDKRSMYGNDPILQAGNAGIRTDFMDVEFDRYSLKRF